MRTVSFCKHCSVTMSNKISFGLKPWAYFVSFLWIDPWVVLKSNRSTIEFNVGLNLEVKGMNE